MRRFVLIRILVSSLQGVLQRAGGLLRLCVFGMLRAAGVVLRLLPIPDLTRRMVRGYVSVRVAKRILAYRERLPWQPYVDMVSPLLAEATRKEGGRLIARDSAAKPQASIVIPVRGQAEWAVHGIRSIAQTTMEASYEIIVVDDGSVPWGVETWVNLPAIRWLRPGPEGAANAGAHAARADLVVFLADVLPQHGWLDILVETFADFPECGLAGSLHLLADARVEHAGGLRDEAGGVTLLGRGHDPAEPRLAYLRDVDWCSTATAMIRAELLPRVGAFEPGRDAASREADLAARVRATGARVLLQPLARVGPIVTGEMGVPVQPLPVDCDRNLAGRVLVIDHCTPTPDQDAGSVTALGVMRIVQSLGMKVTFVPEDSMLYLERYTARLQRLGIECLYAPHVRSLRSHLAASGHRYDAVIFFRVANATRHLDDLELYCPQAKLVFHTSDLHFLRFERQAEIEGSASLREDAAVLKERELATMRRTHATIVHSTVEKALLDDLLGWREASRIHVLGWSIPIVGTSAPFASRDGIVFVGGYQHRPNVDAVEYFVDAVFPLVRARLPRARFLIVGSRAPESLKDIRVDGVEFLGHVQDLGRVLDRCRLSVAPLRYGAGTKGKVYTSLSHGLPCVATSIGAEGMDLVDGEDILVADTAEGLAERVVRLHEDEALWSRMSANGYAFIRSHASVEVGERVLGTMFRGLGLDRERRHVAAPARSPDPREVVVASRGELEEFMASELARRRRHYEDQTVRKHSGSQDAYDLEGWCEVCEAPSAFHVDQSAGATHPWSDRFWVPDWGESCVCVHCGLNARQRVLAARLRDEVGSSRVDLQACKLEYSIVSPK